MKATGGLEPCFRKPTCCGSPQKLGIFMLPASAGVQMQLPRMISQACLFSAYHIIKCLLYHRLYQQTQTQRRGASILSRGHSKRKPGISGLLQKALGGSSWSKHLHFLGSLMGAPDFQNFQWLMAQTNKACHSQKSLARFSHTMISLKFRMRSLNKTGRHMWECQAQALSQVRKGTTSSAICLHKDVHLTPGLYILKGVLAACNGPGQVASTMKQQWSGMSYRQNPFEQA